MDDRPEKFNAALSLVGGEITWNGEEMLYHSGQTPPTDAELDAELKKLQDAYDAQEYARTRAAEYPDMGTQFNKIYDDGITKWKSEMVDPVKAKWPKDNSGPK